MAQLKGTIKVTHLKSEQVEVYNVEENLVLIFVYKSDNEIDWYVCTKSQLAQVMKESNYAES